MTFYDRASTTAMRLLEKYGRPWIFTSTDSAGTVTTRDSVGTFLDTVRHTLGDSGVDIGDKRYIFASDSMPQKNDRMKNGTEDYVVVFADPIGDTPAAYYVWGRSG